jgi:hypothetical protein
MAETSVNNFFGITVDGFWKNLFAGLTGAEIIASLKDQALTQVAPEEWPGVIAGIATRAQALFDVDISWVIVSGWGQYRELMEYTIADRHNPRDTHLVPLGKHSMNVDYSPFFEVQFKGQPLGKLVFDVKMSFDLEGFLLTIQASKIMKVRTGSCEGKGKIEFKGHCLIEKPLTKIILPATLNLGEGVALPRSDGQAH